MSTDLDTQIRGYADYFDTTLRPVEVEEVLDRPLRLEPKPPRQRWGWVERPGWVVALAAGLVVLLVVGGAALIIRLLGDESEPPASPTVESLVDLQFGDIPAFRATYTVAAAVIEVSYGGPGVGFRLEAVEARPDLLDTARSALPGHLCEGGLSVWDGELLGTYLGCEPEELFSVESTATDFEALGYLGWHTLGLLTAEVGWQEFCRGVDHQDLPIETVAGRTALHIRCVGTRDDIELWVDANTGLVLRLAGSRGDPGWPGDFEAVAVDYEPVFAADTFLVEAPPGVGDARQEQPTTEEPPFEPTEPTPADFLRSLRSIGLAEGEIAPPFSGPLLDGGTFDLTQLRGQPVLVMLWADWCPPCVDSLAPFQAVADQWAGRVQFVSVLTLESTPEAASQIVQEQNFTVPVVIDLTDGLWNQLAIPGFVLLDAEGRAIAGNHGTAGDDPESAAQNLNKLLELFLG